MTNTLVAKNIKEKKKSPFQQLFNQLSQKIEILQKDILECTKALDMHLEFYENELFPKINKNSELLRKLIKLLYPHFEDTENLRKEERSILKQAIVSLFDGIVDIEGDDMNLDEELLLIFRATVGFCYKDQQNEEFEAFKKNMESQYLKKGICIDLSEVKIEGSREEAMNQVMDVMSDQGAFDEKETSKESKTRSKKQIKRENHSSSIKDLEKKEIRTIYKQLAKTLHPDLELDPVIKLEKDVEMKKLTSAYEELDLYTLQSMEVEIKQEYNDEQLKVYNRILQAQVETLQEKMRMLPMDPKYNCLKTYSSYQWKKGESFLNKVQREIDDQLQFHSQMINQCQSENALQAVRQMIDSYRINL